MRSILLPKMLCVLDDYIIASAAAAAVPTADAVVAPVEALSLSPLSLTILLAWNFE